MEQFTHNGWRVTMAPASGSSPDLWQVIKAECKHTGKVVQGTIFVSYGVSYGDAAKAFLSNHRRPAGSLRRAV